MAQPECCQSEKNREPWITGALDTPSGEIPIVSTTLDKKDRMGRLRARVSGFRMRYTVKPGLYAAGRPNADSPILVSTNYKLSFDILRSSIEGLDAYLLVLDTKGINVWCAAGKGTFGTEELVSRIRSTNLERIVRHRRIVLPQLGAPGVRAHVVRKETRFRVSYGPVYARDIPKYLENGFRATDAMRTVRFTLKERFVLTPMEIVPGYKKYLVYCAAVFVLFGLQPEGILFRPALTGGLHFVFLGALGILAGGVLTPLLLPVLPFRSFSLKGLVTGLIVCAVYWALLLRGAGMGIHITAMVFLLFPALSSYFALNFTGSTPFTGMSGVKKEVKAAVPVYIVSASVSLVLFTLYKIETWGIP
ncbi:MAG: acetyl-CoA synthase subunit gamma [Spirochaetes bacterium]|nr:acetyl-CoA synthase subunit gamma [Spirochaetota bacterium]